MADNNFKVNRGLTLNPQPSAPASPVDGDVYYDSTLEEFRFYQNGAWETLGGGGGGGVSSLNGETGALNLLPGSGVTITPSGTNITIAAPFPASIQTYLGSTFQPFVDQSATMIPTLTTGSPAAGTFYSSIANRGAMVDLSKDLKARIGIERLQFTDILALPMEIGPSGELVYGSKGDQFNQIRFIGSWSRSVLHGESIVSSTTGDSFEVVFYGTGISILAALSFTGMSATWSIDGGVASSNFFLSNYNNVLNQSGIPMASNQELMLINGLTAGIHTLRVVLTASTAVTLYGIGIMNDSSNVTVTTGSSLLAGKTYTTSTTQTFAYNAAVTGSKGGRILVYQNSDGSIGQSFTPVNVSSTSLGSTSHLNESISEILYPRNFGLGVNTSGDPGTFEDFGGTAGVDTALAYTQSDGLTTIRSNSARDLPTGLAGYFIVVSGVNSHYLTVTFVGCGLDLERIDNTSGTSDTYTVTLDGTSLGTLSTTGTLKSKTIPICGGLPYGTHTIQIAVTSSTGSGLSGFPRFIVYQPSLPALPSDSVELAQYNVLANFVANTSGTTDTIATGVLRKQNMREWTYSGAGWGSSTPLLIGSYTSGYEIATGSTGDTSTNYFWGTGFDFRFIADVTGTPPNVQVLIDGLAPSTTNFPSVTSGFYGDVSSFSAGSGASTGDVVTLVNAALNIHSGFWVNGLSLGWHKLTVTTTNSFTSGNGWNPNCLDIITPIYVPSHTGINGDPIGSVSIADTRKIVPVNSFNLAKKGLMSRFGTNATWSLTTTVTGTYGVPVPDMFGYFVSDGAPVVVNFSVVSSNSGGNNFFQLYIDGQPYGNPAVAGSTSPTTCSYSISINLPAGLHFVSLAWYVSAGTGTLLNLNRHLAVMPSI